MSDPSGYQFDGHTWSETKDFAVVDELISARHQSKINSQHPFLGRTWHSRFLDWPFDLAQVLPDFSQGNDDTRITTDKNGLLWIGNGVSLYRNTVQGFQNIQEANGEWNTDQPDLKTSSVLGFGTRVFYHEIGKRPIVLPWVVDTDLIWEDIYYFVDQRAVAWFYHAEKGLVAVDRKDVQYLGKLPVYLPAASIGGIIARNDGRVWVGSIGSIWEYNNGRWHQFVVPTDELFRFFVEDQNGGVYAATDTGVYQFDNAKFTYHNFVVQDQKPFVISEDGTLIDDCSFHKNYTVIADCTGIFWGEPSPAHHYKAIFLGMQKDGSITYINTHVVARLEKSEWKSFLFDTITISSAAVDLDGKTWIFSSSDGLLRLDPGIFGEYQDLVLP